MTMSMANHNGIQSNAVNLATDIKQGLIQMRLINFILIIGLGFFNYPVVIHADDISSASTVFVLKLDGTVHCENSKGITLDSMEQKLTSAGIRVFSRRKGYDGWEGIALCGEPTGQVNIYEIASSGLSVALKLGFKPSLLNNWKNQKIDNYSGGPFADRTGGLIMFESSDIEKAIELTEKDPFIENDVIDSKWVKEWIQK